MTSEDPEVRPRASPGRVLAIVLAALVNLALVAAIIVIATNPQRLSDQIAVWRYEPSATIAAYAERTDMTDEGRFLFYASRPAVMNGDDFDRICAAHLEDVGVLGCYVHADRRIYLFDVTDERLDGIEEVVAAHEMLHAAWARMSDDERERIGGLLEAEVAARPDDTALAETLAFYAQVEPGQRANELHSILGTEYRNLGAELSTYYDRYFADRSVVVSLQEQSNAVFEQQQAEIDALVTQLDALRASIDADYAAYNAGYDQLNADILAFNARAASGAFESYNDFEAERDALMQRQDELDALFGTIQTRADEHAALIVQLEALNAEVDELNASINVQPRTESPVG